LQRFIATCRLKRVEWAIFSDLYGIWFPFEKHGWYEKDPASVTQQEFQQLLVDFDRKLNGYDAIFFYHNPGRFHPLYKRLLSETALREKVTPITHIIQIA
jgi:hypothetical protein